MNPYDNLDRWQRHARLCEGGHDEYVLYLRSAPWTALRARLIRERGATCQRCGRGFLVVLELHHLTYRRIGCELDRDLLVLCHPCHEQADVERRSRYARTHALALL